MNKDSLSLIKKLIKLKESNIFNAELYKALNLSDIKILK